MSKNFARKGHCTSSNNGRICAHIRAFFFSDGECMAFGRSLLVAAASPVCCRSVVHCEDDAETHFAAVHLRVGFGYTAERKFLDHGMDIAQGADSNASCESRAVPE